MKYAFIIIVLLALANEVLAYDTMSDYDRYRSAAQTKTSINLISPQSEIALRFRLGKKSPDNNPIARYTNLGLEMYEVRAMRGLLAATKNTIRKTIKQNRDEITYN